MWALGNFPKVLEIHVFLLEPADFGSARWEHMWSPWVEKYGVWGIQKKKRRRDSWGTGRMCMCVILLDSCMDNTTQRCLSLSLHLYTTLALWANLKCHTTHVKTFGLVYSECFISWWVCKKKKKISARLKYFVLGASERISVIWMHWVDVKPPDKGKHVASISRLRRG